MGGVEDRHADQQQHLEHEQLHRHGEHLAEVDAGGVEARQAQRVTVAVGRLDRERALEGQQAAEQDRDPVEARRGLLEQAPVGVEGEGEQHQHEQGERAAPG